MVADIYFSRRSAGGASENLHKQVEAEGPFNLENNTKS